MIVNGDLDLRNSSIKSLGKLIEVKGDLNLARNYNLKDLGKLKKVSKNLDLSNCIKLSSLGNLEEVNGSLHLTDCELITSLGKLKKVKSLHLENLKDFVNLDLENLKDLVNLDLEEISGSLNLYSNQKLTDFKIKIVSKNLSIRFCKNLKSLKNLEYVGGNLDLIVGSIVNFELPKKLIVGGDFSLYTKHLTKLPEDLKIGHSLIISGMPIKILPNYLTLIKGELNLSECVLLESINKVRFVNGDLNLIRSNIKYLPENLTIKGNLFLFQCKNLNRLPNGLLIDGYLDLKETNIDSLPNDLKIKGNLYLKNSKITKDYIRDNFSKTLFNQCIWDY